MKNNGFPASLCLLIGFPILATAQQLPPLASIVNPSTLEKLKTEGKVIVTASGAAAASISMGLNQPAMETLKSEVRAEKPGILVEALFLYQGDEPADTKGEFTGIYRRLTELGSLQGIDYWSASRKAWRTFYADSWRIADPGSRSRLSDEQPPVLPPLMTLYAYQRDLSFGANVYRYDYRVIGGAEGQVLLVTQTNLTRMSYGIIPLVAEEGLRTRILVIPLKEGILFYAASAANSPPVPFLNGKLEDSFSNRAEALFKWFGARVGKTRT